MNQYFTTGQIAKKLRVSSSTLKRWINDENVIHSTARNSNGWRLFTEQDLVILTKYKREKKKNGKNFTNKTLQPVL